MTTLHTHYVIRKVYSIITHKLKIIHLIPENNQFVTFTCLIQLFYKNIKFQIQFLSLT
jgi:hypothetical protein